MSQNEQNSPEHETPRSLEEDLEIKDLSRCLVFKDEKLFSVAGPGIPPLQLNTDGTFVSLPPDRPYNPEINESLDVQADEHGRLLDALGELRKLSGMTFKGKQVYMVAERHPQSGQHLAAWFDENFAAHYIYLGNEILSAPMILRIRNRMIDGELSRFEELSSE